MIKQLTLGFAFLLLVTALASQPGGDAVGGDGVGSHGPLHSSGPINVGGLRFVTTDGTLTGTGTSTSALGVASGGVTNTQLATAAAYTVKGNATNATASVTDIAASSAGQVLGRTGGTSLAWSIPASDMFGDGFQGGPFTFDGSTTILGIVPSASTYVLAADISVTSMTVNSGITIQTAGYRIFVSGTLTNNGHITDNGLKGTDGSGSTGGGGGASRAAGFYNATHAGGSGGSGAAGGTAPGTENSFPRPYLTANASAIAHHQNGTIFQGGGGGNGSGTAGGGGGAINVPAVTVGNMDHVAMRNGWNQPGTRGLTWCSAGGGGGGSASSSGGGGGAPGGIVYIAAKVLAGTGTFESAGGNGGNGAGAGVAGGGGGGGSGCFVVLAYLTNTGSWTTVITGGTHGTAQGTGETGGDGGSGTVIKYNLSGDGT